MATRKGTTVYLYELAWILPSFAIPVGMLVALGVTAFGAGGPLAGLGGGLDPAQGPARAPGRAAEPHRSDNRALVGSAPGQSEVRRTAQIWSFAPNEIRVPAGS